MELAYESMNPPLVGDFRGAVTLSASDLSGSVYEYIVSCSAEGHYPNFIHVLDARITSDRTPIVISRTDPITRERVAELASLGYLLYHSSSGEARFVHRARIPTLWSPVMDGSIKVDENGVYYTIDVRLPKADVNRLVVVFSGVAAKPSSPWLSRYFEPNYRHLTGLTSADTAILRIADVGGVVGAFYGPTRDRPNNRIAVTGLIDSVIRDLGVRRDRVCLVGSSKGATGAVLHGLISRLPFVAVDPIVSDRFYEDVLNDAHFTSGPVFFESKDDVFGRLVSEIDGRGDMFAGFLTSPHSEQYNLVRDFYSQLTGSSGLFSTADPRIDGHPAVAGSTLGMTVTLVNCVVHNLPLWTGCYSFV
ncbi:hypothetical protein BAURA86_03671 [Brevibacterium aurantiacum]|uniref:XcbB/CpsF family capsular polysaccharide biosynthesis protein n=1 Tax=Brevibacterium aurantiacum TaxID=273384 RepID=A0A2H1KXB3_BREAU|nr:XcbB/CpsF family capsular polysaccharide biosynthesis protein [Brevibacterium aurantiacum]SMY04413.1 hypothetical protein BAURA86_03671 [Brevibacterium aurantiacum]